MMGEIFYMGETYVHRRGDFFDGERHSLQEKSLPRRHCYDRGETFVRWRLYSPTPAADTGCFADPT